MSPPGSISSTTSRSVGNRVELELSGPSNYPAVDDQGRMVEAEGARAGVDGQTADLSAVSSHRQVILTLTSICIPIIDTYFFLPLQNKKD